MSLIIKGYNQNIVWKDINANLQMIENKFQALEADIFLLPEMFTTGFYMHPQELATDGRETLKWMQKFSEMKNAAVAGSIMVKENDQFFNRFYFVSPEGAVSYYNKRHLFSYSGEDQIFEKGDKKVIVTFRGFKIALQICYDLRFPVFIRNTEEYDIILYVANWPESRVDIWKTLLKARAIENQCYVFGLNRIGIDGNHLQYSLSSQCYFPDGREISTTEDEITTAVLEYKELNLFRKKFSFLQDRDTFTINWNDRK